MQIGGALGSLVRPPPARLPSRTAHPAGRRRRGRHLGGVPHPARRGAARRRGALPRRLRVRRAGPGRPRQRDGLLGRHLDLRRERRCSRRRRASPSSPAHLPLYALLALCVSVLAIGVPLVAAHRAAGDGVAVAAHLGPPRAGRAWRSASSALPIIVHGRVAPGPAGAGGRPAGRRLRRRADRHHRRQLAAARVDRRGAAAVALRWRRSSPPRSPSARAAARATSPRRW